MSRSERLVASIVAATALTCGIGIGVRLAACSRPCISDLPGLYRTRDVRPGAAPYVDRNLEYPVLVGAAFWAATFVAHAPRSFFVVTSLFCALLALVTAGLLARRYGRRAWYFALAPPLALYAPANWDMLAVAPAVGGLLAFESGLDLTAGALLGVGAAAKLYPGLFVAPLVVARLRRHDVRGALRLAGASAAVVAAVNLPVLALSTSGWLYPLRFQSRRSATWGSLWHYLVQTPAQHPWLGHAAARSVVNAGALLTLVAGVGIATWLVWRGRLGPVAASAVATAVFLLTNKVYSPQYDLWLVPFFVMVALPRRDYVAFVAADAAVFVFVFAALGHHFRATPIWYGVLELLVVARALVLVVTIRDCGRRGGASPELPAARAHTLRPRPVAV